MTQDNPTATLQRMETMLRRSRRRIRAAQLTSRFREGLNLYLRGLLLIAGIFLALRALIYVFSLPPVINGLHLLAVAVVFGIVVFGRALVLGLQSKFDQTTDAAERLDLSQATHNRVATAIALLRAGDDSPFASSAVDDGFQHLERLQAAKPHVDPSRTSWRRISVYVALSSAMIVASLLLPHAPQSPDDDDPKVTNTQLLANLDAPPETTTSETEVKTRKPAATPNQLQITDRPASREEEEPEDSDEAKRLLPDSESPSKGPAAQQASGKANSSQSASNSSSSASGAGAKSEPGENEPAKQRKPQAPKKKDADQPKVNQENKKSGSINARGSSGAGSMRTAQNEWSSKVKAKANDSDELEQEEEPDDEIDSDKQRLGVQPSLKNRTAKVDRELSLALGTGDNDNPMKGRGGPNAQKKSRGTATMIMGIPVPGFVKGRLLPGPTKSTQEEVQPTPRAGEYASASNLKTASPKESTQESYRPTAAMSVMARDYLIKYHADNEK